MTLLPRSKIVVHMLHINETNAPEPTESEMGRGRERERAAEKRVRAMRGKQMGKIVNRLLIHIINYIKNKIYEVEAEVEDEEICSRRETNQTTTFHSAKHNSPNRPNAMNESTWFCPKYDSVGRSSHSWFHVVNAILEWWALSVCTRDRAQLQSDPVFVSKNLFHFSRMALNIWTNLLCVSSSSARCLAWCEVVEVESSCAYYIPCLSAALGVTMANWVENCERAHNLLACNVYVCLCSNDVIPRNGKTWNLAAITGHVFFFPRRQPRSNWITSSIDLR